MNKKCFKKRYITLIEMMIVMFLIAMITGVVAYNYTGSLEKGKAFKTEAAMEKIRTILDLHMATHPGDTTEWKEVVKKSPLVKNADDLIKDGWGVEFVYSTDNNGNPVLSSVKYAEYKARNGSGSSTTSSGT